MAGEGEEACLLEVDKSQILMVWALEIITCQRLWSKLTEMLIG